MRQANVTHLVGHGEKKHVGHELEPSDGAKTLGIDLSGEKHQITFTQ